MALGTAPQALETSESGALSVSEKHKQHTVKNILLVLNFSIKHCLGVSPDSLRCTLGAVHGLGYALAGSLLPDPAAAGMSISGIPSLWDEHLSHVAIML